MRISFSKPSLRAFSGLSVNLSAAWFATAFIPQNFVYVSRFAKLTALTGDIALGILFLIATIKFEELSE